MELVGQREHQSGFLKNSYQFVLSAGFYKAWEFYKLYLWAFPNSQLPISFLSP